MSWVWVGVGAAVGATAGAISGSRTGGDDVWKQALGGAALGGAAGGAGYAAFGPAAAGAAPAAVAPEAAVVAGGAAPAAGGIMSVAPTAATAAPTATTAAYGSTAPLGSSVVPSAYGGAGSGLTAGSSAGMPSVASGSSGIMSSSQAAAMPYGMQAPIQMITPTAEAASPQLLDSMARSGMSYDQQASLLGQLQSGNNPAAMDSMSRAGLSFDQQAAIFNNTPNASAGQSIAQGYTPPPVEDSPLKKGFESAKNWLSEPKNAMLTGVLGLGALSMFNNDNENNFGQPDVQPAGYPLSPNFRPSRYEPTRRYADGGLTDLDIGQREAYARNAMEPVVMMAEGGDTDSKRERYYKNSQQYAAMIDPRMKAYLPETPDWVRSRGVYHDEDTDTKYEDALTAAQTRMGKAAKRANVRLGAMQKPTPMGQLNLGPVAGAEEERKASGGITSLGGYAHGGNPRLLRGPGDGMSDDIPATIADEQPARLADGEFVVPADVVSGLGNGSTEAGAKKLHQMMDKVRVDRTGTKKQGKEIKAEKYLPGVKAEKKAAGGIASFAFGGLSNQSNDGNIDYSQYYVYDAAGNQVPMSAILNATQAQTGAPATTSANIKPTAYDPNYYNPQYYQSQLDAANQQIAAQQATLARPTSYGQAIGTEGQTINLKPGTQVVYGADGRYSAPVTVGESGILDLSNQVFGDPNVGVVKQAYVYDPNVATAEQIAAANKLMAEQQPLQQSAQEALQRLQNTPVKYDPYTIANRPSAAEPQFYGNIYQEHYFDYAKPGYDMNANLGVWNNEFGGSTAATPQQARIAEIAAAQQATGQAEFQQAQAAAQRAMQPKEEKKRKGGILAAKR